MTAASKITTDVIEQSCLEFLIAPYLCYTEHGYHAYFYSKLLEAIPQSDGEASLDGRRVRRVQKEYPTAGKLGKSRRQHWDIAVLRTPATPIPGKSRPYDHLQLDCVVEFGLNEKRAHLKDDIERVSHKETGTECAFIVHLYRLSNPLISSRDWSHRRRDILTAQEIQDMLKRYAFRATIPVVIYLAQVDASGHREKGLWRIDMHGIGKLKAE